MLPKIFTPTYMRQLEMFTLHSRRAFLGQRQGAHHSLKRGHGIEFFDYRQYELGDNPRHIDWGLYGRSEKLYVKRFREEQQLSVLLMLDSSPSMAVRQDEGLSQWQYAQNLALSIAYIAFMKQDSVYLAITSGGGIPRFAGGQGIHRAANYLDNVRHVQPKSISHEVLRASSRIRFPGMAVFLSDLLFPFEELERSINILLAKNLDVTVIRVSSPLEQDPFRGIQNALAIDSETGEEVEMNVERNLLMEYQSRLNQHLDRAKKFLAQRSVRFIQVKTDQVISDVMVGDMVSSGIVQ